MERKELIEKVIAKLSGDPELLKTVGELTLDEDDFAPAKGQLPDTMYVLTGKVRVKTDGDENLYHYHPVIEDCFLNPEATENRMVCSESLINLQEMKKQYDSMSPTELVILAVSKENFKKLQNQLDEMIADLLGSIRHASERLIAENEARVPKGSLDFEKLYRAITTHLMTSSGILESGRLVREFDADELDADESEEFLLLVDKVEMTISILQQNQISFSRNNRYILIRENEVPLGGKKGMFKWEMLIMQLYPWLSVREVSSNIAADGLLTNTPGQQLSDPSKTDPVGSQKEPDKKKKGFFSKLFGKS